MAGRPVAAPDHPAEAQEYFLLRRLPRGMRHLPVERYEQARRAMARMPRFSSALNLALPAENDEIGLAWEDGSFAKALGAWQALGPGNIGGRTRALLIHPQQPRTLYAAGVSGGVWKSTNAGQTWAPLADRMANLAVSTLAMDPHNPNILYAGTGELFGTGLRGAGIFRSLDGGTHWQLLESTKSYLFWYVNDLAVSPTDGNRLYAATALGVFRSLDGGQSWTAALTDPDVGACYELALRTDRPTDTLFAACEGFSNQPGAIWRNAAAEGEGGWEAVQSEPGMVGRISLALAPSDQDVIYALAAATCLHAVFRSTEGGVAGSWTARVRSADPDKLSTALLSNPLFVFGKECFGADAQSYCQGNWDNVIAVDPVNPDRVWAGGIDLFRSDDGGASWGIASYWWRAPTLPGFVHADQHAIVFHPFYNGTTNRVLFVSNDGGIFRTDDALATVGTDAAAVCGQEPAQVRWASLNRGFAVTQFYHGLPFPGGTRYLGGTQDNGTLQGTDAGGVNGWTQVLGGDGGYVAIDPRNPRNIYITVLSGFSVYKSTDGGKIFIRAIDGTTPDRGYFVHPLVMDPASSQRLWMGSDSLWRTANGARTWTRASPSLEGVTAIGVSPRDPNHILAGNGMGYIYRTLKGLTTTATTPWARIGPLFGFISSFAFDPVDSKIAYATVSTFGHHHVWRTRDRGATWTAIDGSGATALPDVPALSIAVDPADRSRLYVGTDLGLFVSVNGGASWMVEATKFPFTLTESLSIQTGPGGTATLFAFTHGRGVWRLRLR